MTTKQQYIDQLIHAVDTRDLRQLERLASSMSYHDLRKLATDACIDLDELEELLAKL